MGSLVRLEEGPLGLVGYHLETLLDGILLH